MLTKSLEESLQIECSGQSKFFNTESDDSEEENKEDKTISLSKKQKSNKNESSQMNLIDSKEKISNWMLLVHLNLLTKINLKIKKLNIKKQITTNQMTSKIVLTS